MGSLKDVARLAGVSVSTVSYVINGKKTVRPETYQKIMAAIEEVDYHPNIAARSLKTNSTKSIGIIVADFSNIFYIDVLAGIEGELAKCGYSAIISNSRNDEKTERFNLKEIIHRNVDGIILLGTGGDAGEYTEELNIPVISVDRVNEETKYAVTTDNGMGGYIAARHLLQKGRRKLAYLGFNQRISSQDRLKGFRRAMEDYGLPPEENMIYMETDISPEGGYETTLKLFSSREGHDCSGIFVSADYMGFGVLKALSDLGYRVPEDVSVMGYDDIQLSNFSSPPMTTISQPKDQMGVEAARMLVKILNGEEVEKRIVLEPKLVIRGSV